MKFTPGSGSVRRSIVLRALILFSAAFVVVTARAATYAGNPSSYRSLLAGLRPGDVLELASGTYTEGLPLGGMNGAPGAPIIIRGPVDRSAVFLSRSCCNTIQFDRSSYVEVANLTIDGNNLPEPFGVDSSDWSHHITIENNLFRGFGADQLVCAISTKAPAWNWIIRRNTITGAGTGIYLGNSDGSAAFVAGLIEYNVVLDTLGYSMEIKHQNPRPTGIGMPVDASRTIIRHNVFSKLNNASGGSLARPNLLVGHFPLSGAGTNDIYEIYGNFLYANPTEALFQGEGNLVVHDNVLVNASGDGLIVMPHNDVPRLVEIFNNTVVARDRGIRVTGAAAGYVQRIVSNAAFASSPLSGPNPQGNVTGSYADAATYLVAPFAIPGQLNLYPRAGMLADARTDISLFSAYTDYARDFNSTTRTGTFRGAYEGEGVNPGWTLALATKVVQGAALPAPAISLNATPGAVSPQGRAQLSWTVTNATACTASGGWTGQRAVAGSETTVALTADTRFDLQCTGAGGTASSSILVSVTTPSVPTLTLTVAPSATTLPSGSTVTLSWQSSGASSCTGSGAWSGAKSVTGTEAIGPLTATGTFTLNCTGPGGSASASVSVNIEQSAGAGGAPVPGGGGATGMASLLGLLSLQRLRRNRASAGA